MELFFTVVATLASGALAAIIVRRWQNIDKIRRTANFARILLYACKDNIDNYGILWQNANEARRIKVDIAERAKIEEAIRAYNRVFEYGTSKWRFCNAAIQVIKEDDVLCWQKHQEEFVQLEIFAFDNLYKYFMSSRPNSIYYFATEDRENLFKTMTDYSTRVAIILNYLVNESERPFFDRRFTNKFQTAYDNLKQLYADNQIHKVE